MCSVLGGQVLAETDSAGNFQRGYVYLGGQLLAMQAGGVRWVHLVKSQRVTDASGALQAVVELDPWGGETSRSWQQGPQPHRYTSYERDGSGNDQAMHRQYHSYWMRFDQPDPYDGSYNLTDPQSLNRYSYVQNDPVNFVDPTGLNPAGPGTSYGGSYWVSWTATGHFVGNTLVGISDFRYSITPLPGSGSGDSGASPQNPSTLTHELGHSITTCNQKFASTFGDPGAVGRTDYEYNGVYRGRNPALASQVAGNGRNALGNAFFDAEHLYNFPHLSGNQTGTENTSVYVPGNYQGRPTGPTATAGVVTFYYPEFFGMRDVTLAVFHVGNFGLQREGSRMRIGSTGGPGGDSGGLRPNLHSHFELWRGNTKFLPPGAKRDAARTPLTPVICP